MSTFTHRHHGHFQQMWQTRTSCLVKKVCAQSFQYQANRWQNISHQQYANHIHAQYFSWQCHQRVQRSHWYWHVHDLTEHYQDRVGDVWQVEQARYRYRIPLWERRYQQAWYWQHTGQLHWEGEAWFCQVSQRRKRVKAYQEQADIHQQQGTCHHTRADAIQMQTEQMQLGDGQGCYVYA